MVNYADGKIYRIDCLTSGLVYFGATCKKTVAQRLAKHVNNYNTWVRNNTNKYMTSFEVLKNNNYIISLIEECPCENKDQLNARESFFIRNNDCVNKTIPNRTSGEYNLKYRNDNAEKIKKYNATPRKCNVCNCHITIIHISRHNRTQTHLKNLAKQSGATLPATPLLEPF